MTETTSRRAEGQTLAYVLEVNNNSTVADYVGILNCKPVRALAQHSDCEGTSHLYSINWWGFFSINGCNSYQRAAGI